MGTFVIVLCIIVSVLLGLIILIQNPKGGGLATGFTGANQIGGVKRTTDFLEKATWSLAILLLVLSITSTGIEKSQSITNDGLQDLIEETIPVAPLAAPVENNSSPTIEGLDEGEDN